MVTKTKTINLQQVLGNSNSPNPGAYEYKIVKLTNSVEYRCGDRLTKAQVDELCTAAHWVVNVS